MNHRGCPACIERYPARHGWHELPNGCLIVCLRGTPSAMHVDADVGYVITPEELREAAA